MLRLSDFPVFLPQLTLGYAYNSIHCELQFYNLILPSKSELQDGDITSRYYKKILNISVFSVASIIIRSGVTSISVSVMLKPHIWASGTQNEKTISICEFVKNKNKRRFQETGG